MKACTVRRLPGDLELRASRVAEAMNPLNGIATMDGPARGSMRTRKKWPVGQVITVGFLDGSATQQQRVQKYFHEWERYANLKFVFITNLNNAYVRVSFRPGEGSWSYLGTDSMMVGKNEPTMVFGWLQDGTEEQEYARVVRHEVGHSIGFDHEDQQPAQDIKWNVPKIVAYYMGPPNFWSRADVDQQVLNKIVPAGSEYTVFDRYSIMAYAVPDEFTLDGKGVPWNTELSVMDKQFAAQMYPGVIDLGTPTPPPPNIVIPQIKVGGPEVAGFLSPDKPVAEFGVTFGAWGKFRVWTSYLNGPVFLVHPSDPNNPVAVGIQQFVARIPAGDYRVRLVLNRPGETVKVRVNARRVAV